MRNDNSGAIIVVLIGFILLGFFIYYAGDITNQTNLLQVEKQGLMQQIAKLDEEKQMLEQSLQDSSMDLQAAQIKIKNYNQKVSYVRNQLEALGLWEALDEQSKAILTDLTVEWIPPSQSPTPITMEYQAQKNPEWGSPWIMRFIFMLGFFFLAGGMLWGWNKLRVSKNVFQMKVTRKEAEVLNHLRRNRYF